MNRHGMTLLEVTVATTIMVFIMGVLFAMSRSIGETTRLQNSKITASDEARKGMMFLVKELRQASRQSIQWGELPSNSLSYQIATDVDGNGLAVDVSGNLELSGMRTIGPDVEDANNDGMTTTQLILIDGTTTRVIANSLRVPSANSGGVPEDGILFTQTGNGVLVAIQTESQSGAQGHSIYSTMSELVVPRN